MMYYDVPAIRVYTTKSTYTFTSVYLLWQQRVSPPPPQKLPPPQQNRRHNQVSRPNKANPASKARTNMAMPKGSPNRDQAAVVVATVVVVTVVVVISTYPTKQVAVPVCVGSPLSYIKTTYLERKFM